MKTTILIISLLLIAGCTTPEQTEGNNAPTITMEEAKAIAETSDCMKEGSLTGKYFHNPSTNTWWFETNIQKEGCSPACVVDEKTKNAEINWRCTGLLIE